MDNIFGEKQLKINRTAGDLKKAHLEDGTTVYRKDSIYIDEIGLVKCPPMDNHFIFRHLFKGRGWTLWCTCSSPAAVHGYSAYARDASAQGQMLLCMHHAMYNRHADGGT